MPAGASGIIVRIRIGLIPGNRGRIGKVTDSVDSRHHRNGHRTIYCQVAQIAG